MINKYELVGWCQSNMESPEFVHGLLAGHGKFGYVWFPVSSSLMNLCFEPWVELHQNRLECQRFFEPLKKCQQKNLHMNIRCGCYTWVYCWPKRMQNAKSFSKSVMTQLHVTVTGERDGRYPKDSMLAGRPMNPFKCLLWVPSHSHVANASRDVIPNWLLQSFPTPSHAFFQCLPNEEENSSHSQASGVPFGQVGKCRDDERHCSQRRKAGRGKAEGRREEEEKRKRRGRKEEEEEFR